MPAVSCILANISIMSGCSWGVHCSVKMVTPNFLAASRVDKRAFTISMYSRLPRNGEFFRLQIALQDQLPTKLKRARIAPNVYDWKETGWRRSVISSSAGRECNSRPRLQRSIAASRCMIFHRTTERGKRRHARDHFGMEFSGCMRVYMAR
jgi:hypothetical protein